MTDQNSTHPDLGNNAMKEFLTDNHNNKAYVSYFGSEQAAQKALDSLIDCKDCVNCTGCTGCTDCFRCTGCTGCSRCSGCTGCTGCSRCTGCTGCRCTDCSGCSGCTDCSGCSGCTDCSGCSRCSDLFKETGFEASEGPPPVPVIPDIHGVIYAAASAPGALNMERWHCDTTHCRAGHLVYAAGEAGYALEQFYDTELAAMMIYDASDPGFTINPGRFYDSASDALADMRTLAERGAIAEVRS